MAERFGDCARCLGSAVVFRRGCYSRSTRKTTRYFNAEKQEIPREQALEECPRCGGDGFSHDMPDEVLLGGWGHDTEIG